MEKSFIKALQGYAEFQKKYASGDQSVMRFLSHHGQQPHMMVVSCCDSRVDPAVILQCDPGDLFVVRNVANIIPPYEKDAAHHGTSAALEFGVCFLNVKHLILLGHSQCAGMQALLENSQLAQDDFISNWVSLIKTPGVTFQHADDYAKASLHNSYQHCLTFPWIAEKVSQKELVIHRWFFDIESGRIFSYCIEQHAYLPLALPNAF